MLIINQLTVAYQQTNVLENLSLTLEAPAIHGFLGLNGSGKSTLFNTIYGFVKAKKGTILWKEKAVSKKNIGFLTTENFFYTHITGREYLRLFPNNNQSFKLNIWENLLKIPLDKLIDTYSTGMKKKLALLGLLKLDKPILILDEPFNGVDLETVRIIQILLQQLKIQQKIILLSAHVLDTLIHCCDYVHYLDQKQIVKTYTKDNVENMEQDIFQERDKMTQSLIQQAI